MRENVRIRGGLILVSAALLSATWPGPAAAQSAGDSLHPPNEIVRFLEGEWWNVDISVAPDAEVALNEYREKMIIKDPQTLTVTAFKIKGGQDVTSDIIIRLDGDRVTLIQDGFSAHGTKTGNFIALEGTHQQFTMSFRLYLMGDTYIYQKDVWEDGRVVHSQMSYLRRLRDIGN